VYVFANQGEVYICSLTLCRFVVRVVEWHGELFLVEFHKKTVQGGY
jgi:hypothetical protein